MLRGKLFKDKNNEWVVISENLDPHDINDESWIKNQSYALCPEDKKLWSIEFGKEREIEYEIEYSSKDNVYYAKYIADVPLKSYKPSQDLRLSERAFLTKFMIWLETNPQYFLNGLREWRKTISYEEGSIKVQYKDVIDAFLNQK